MSVAATRPREFFRRRTHLLMPIVEHWNWQLQGRCRQFGTATFFADDRETLGQRAQREINAKLICSDCDVQMQCLGHAMRFHEAHGIWGGTTERERARRIASARASGTGL